MKNITFPAVLMGFAWLGVICCILYAIALLDGGPVAEHARFPLAAAQPPASMHWSGAAQFAVIAQALLQLAALWRLRCVGAVMLKAHGFSAPLTRAFRGLGHTLLVYGVFGLLVEVPRIHRLPGAFFVQPERLPFPTLYVLAVGCLFLYAMAWFLQQATHLKAENEAFV